ncbi:MAG: trimeric intracellular cation channel family protein [Alphaproteobacteria bacterium]|nr:trimeric intracellular cation channel family protein [Alphaproteobacteria bacterium]
MNWSDLANFNAVLDQLLVVLTKLLPALDLCSAAVFAITGALVASRKQMDIIGFMWLGVVTGVGGGTLRDLLLGVPVFWVQDATPVVACLIASVIVYFTAHLAVSRYQLILWLDAVGMALVTVAGTAKGIDNGAGPVVAVAMGAITATVGGIIRDILGQEPSILLRKEVYITAALAGAVVYVLLVGFDQGRWVAAISGGLTAFTIRGLALNFGWSLPVYRSRAGRDADDAD